MKTLSKNIIESFQINESSEPKNEKEFIKNLATLTKNAQEALDTFIKIAEELKTVANGGQGMYSGVSQNFINVEPNAENQVICRDLKTIIDNCLYKVNRSAYYELREASSIVAKLKQAK